MGQSEQYRSDLAREKVAHQRTQDKLLEALQRVAELEAGAGLRIHCEDCGELLTEKGALRLYIGVPDKNGNFEGTKKHVCHKCVGGLG